MTEKKEWKRLCWGWGMHVDADGNLHDTFPIPHREAEFKEQRCEKAKHVWYVKAKLHRGLA